MIPAFCHYNLTITLRYFVGFLVLNDNGLSSLSLGQSTAAMFDLTIPFEQ